jgi:HPt (histidine-containing phosphotransfer) domain-containing protein
MTANIMTSELEKYKKNGMPDCLGKPFTSQELWLILLKYLKPISNKYTNDSEMDDEMRKRLYATFVKNNQNIHIEIAEAISAGDKKLAHRLAHTLKGNAGLIGKVSLRNAAEELEALLKDEGNSILKNKIDTLKSELLLVLDELKPLLNEPSITETSHKSLNGGQTIALFEELEFMLKNINPGCLKLLDDIRAVPGTEKLAQQIENYDLESAAITLAQLKESIEL